MRPDDAHAFSDEDLPRLEHESKIAAMYFASVHEQTVSSKIRSSVQVDRAESFLSTEIEHSWSESRRDEEL